jgi:predicted chitinase
MKGKSKDGKYDFEKVWAEEKKRIEKLKFWDGVKGIAGFPQDINVWHVHPVGLVENFGGMKPYLITVELIESVTGMTGPWFMGQGSTSSIFVNDYNQYCANIKGFNKEEFVRILNAALERYEITDPYYQAHFLAQIFHESAHFDTTLEYVSGNGYNPGVHSQAVAMENTQVGDGPKYRGRGIIQLSWKKNYRVYGEYIGQNIVNNPWLIANDMYYAIDAAGWFWRYNGGIRVLFNANGDINILIAHDRDNVTRVTKAVNGGSNGLAERKELYERIKREWNLEPGVH